MEMALDQNLLGYDFGSEVALQMNTSSELDSLNYQSNFMKTTFSKFPDVLLFHRVHNSKGKALYAFIVDGTKVKMDVGIMKVVHFAIPKNEFADGLAHMYTTFKKLNPNWLKIKYVLVDPHFTGTAALLVAFPKAQIVLSVFHVCKYIHEKISQLSLGTMIENWLQTALNKTICLATKSNLQYMHDALKELVKPDVFPQLHAHWLLSNRIWDMHRWRSLSESIEYFQCLEVITRDFSQIFTSGLSLESSITSLATHIRDCRLNVKPPDLVHDVGIFCVPGNPIVSSSVHGSNQEGPKVMNGSGPQSSFGKWCAKKELLLPEEKGKPMISASLKVKDQIRQSLASLCTEPAAKLCLKELEVAEQSVKMMDTSDDIVNVQIMEDFHEVSGFTPKRCTCHFNVTFELPCRHIMAALKEEKKVLQRGLVDEKWWKNRTKYSDNKPFHSDMLEVLKSPWLASEEKAITVQILTNDLMRLLAECSNEEFECRYSTLRELADNWIGPYEQVKL